MPSLDSVTFATDGLQLEGEQGNRRQWDTAHGDLVILQYFAMPPDIGADLDETASLVARYRQTAQRAGGAVLELEVRPVAGVRAVHLILKIPQQPAGVAYLGSLTLPFRDFSYVVRAQCAEAGLTGMRDTAVFAELMQAGEVGPDQGSGQPSGWWTDPFDPSIAAPPARNRSELPVYDARFPDHPLSRLRRLLPRIAATLRVSDEVDAAARFGE